eukprot:48665-Amphidinium_carterae.2
MQCDSRSTDNTWNKAYLATCTMGATKAPRSFGDALLATTRLSPNILAHMPQCRQTMWHALGFGCDTDC